MNKYSAHICNCGRIHFKDNSFLDYLAEDFLHRRVYHTCTNCGRTREVWFNVCGFEGDLNLNSRDVDMLELDSANTSFRVSFDSGTKVPMKSGTYADVYFGGNFTSSDDYFDTESMTVNEDATIVDMERFIQEVNDEEKLQAISSLVVHGLDWSGTKYAH